MEGRGRRIEGVFDRLVKEDKAEGVVLACPAANMVANCSNAVVLRDWGWYIELGPRDDGALISVTKLLLACSFPRLST